MRVFILALILLPTLLFGQKYTTKTYIKEIKENLKIVDKEDTLYLNLLLELGEKQPIYRISYWDTLAVLCDKFGESKKFKNNSNSILNKKSIAYTNMAVLLAMSAEYNKSIKYDKKALKIKQELGNEYEMVISYNNLSETYKDIDSMALAKFFLEKALYLSIKNDYKDLEADSYKNLANFHNDIGDLPKSVEFTIKSAKILEELKDTMRLTVIYNNLGFLNGKIGNFDEAISYLEKAVELAKLVGVPDRLALSYTSLGFTYSSKKDYDKAITYYNKAILIYDTPYDVKKLGNAFNVLGGIYEKLNNLDSAYYYYNMSLINRLKTQDKKGLTSSYEDIASIKLKQDSLTQARNWATKSFNLSIELGYTKNIKSSAKLLSEIYENLGDVSKSYSMYKTYIEVRDSLNKRNDKSKAREVQLYYEFDKEKAVSSKENEKRLALEKQKQKEQFIVLMVVMIGTLFITILLLIIYRRLRITKKQKVLIENQHEEIQSSISYAKRIQNAILPADDLIKELIPNSFILYTPKDVVAGDFYWLEKSDNKIIFAAADCTGHGVPGAMVSVVCHNAMNRAVREFKLAEPGLILDKTREIVLEELSKSNEDVKDGMDIALCSLEDNTLKYAGAHNPLWIVRNNEVLETKADKQPIGMFDGATPFTTNVTELQQGDTIYLFSDGYQDQFGGENDKKFGKKRVKELLLSIQDKSMSEQKEILNSKINKWMEVGSAEQIDDICFMGVKIV